MAKTVVPSEMLTSENKAATCTFADTEFVATLWTGGKKGLEVGKRFGAWPGDVEVVQRKRGGHGGVTCEDVDGEVVLGVRAEDGDCECRYSSLEA